MLLRLLCLFLFSSLSLWAQEKDVFNIARSGTIEEMQKLAAIQQDTLISTNQSGYTPLILATYNGNVPVAKYLIDKNSNIDFVADLGTAATAAAVQNQKEILLHLINAKANLNLGDSKGYTPLIWAIKFEHVEIVKMLLEHGAEKNLVDKKNKTPFEHAIDSENDMIITLLKSES